MLASSILRSTVRTNAATLAGLHRASARTLAFTARQYSINTSKSTTSGLWKRPITSFTTTQRLLPLSSVRFNSNVPSIPTPAVPSVPSVEAFDSVSPLDFTTLTEAQKVIPEQIGFLHELGLDFGFGPTSCIQWLMEHVHVWSGLPWWGSIVAMTVLIRVIQFPGYIKMSDTAAKMREVQPFAKPVFERIKRAQMEKNMVAMSLAKQQLNDIYKRAGVKRKWLMFPLFQIPVFYGVYNLLRNMAELPVPGLLNGGVAWFPDLTSADPLLTLPIVTSAMIGATIYMGGDAGAQNISPQVKKMMVVGLPLISFIFMWKWAAAMTVYFATNAILGFFQNILLRNPAFRDWMGIYPIVKTVGTLGEGTSGEGSAPDMTSMVQNLMGGVKKSEKPVGEWADRRNNRNKQKKYDAYEEKRKVEEVRRKKAIVEEKKRQKTML